MTKEQDLIRTQAVINLTESKKLIIDTIGTPAYLDLAKHIYELETQLKLYDREMNYE